VVSDEGSADHVLIDTSAWIPVLRQRRRGVRSPLQARVDDLLANDLAATTGVVRMELLVGTRDAQAYEELRSLLLGLHSLDTLEADWSEAGRLGQQLRLAGVIVQSTDLLIATIAIRSAVTLLHRDEDFELIAKHTDLKTERYP